MGSYTQPVDVAILEHGTVRFGSQLDFDSAVTLVAVASEDPGCWEDIAAFWPRYRTPAVTEFISCLPLEVVDTRKVRTALEKSDSWLVIDLVLKRVLTGPGIEPFGRDEVFDMSGDETGERPIPLSIHLPPWWEMWEQTDAHAIDRDRESPLRVPRVDRPVLFGKPLVEDFARRILDIAESDEWKSRGAIGDGPARDACTRQVHRDWLMTPRDDLGGRMPREMLHGGREWIDRLVWSQQLRHQHGGEIVAAEIDYSIEGDEPMGGEEIVIYFDLCRELIEAGWEWCAGEGQRQKSLANRSLRERELSEFLLQAKEEWLSQPFEGGAPPRFVIECSRRRVPRAAGVSIVGMDEQEPEEHVIDCDCPLCIMMAEGSFGTAFVSLDGHHLELENEFAFSMCETREEWEEQQQEVGEMRDAFDRNLAGQGAGDDTESDEFASIWQGHISDEPLPGDSRDHLRLAFLMAEIVGILKSAGASREDIRQANETFADWRHCDPDELSDCTRRFGERLEDLARQYPELVSRVADFQSRLVEGMRSSVTDDE